MENLEISPKLSEKDVTNAIQVIDHKEFMIGRGFKTTIYTAQLKDGNEIIARSRNGRLSCFHKTKVLKRQIDPEYYKFIKNSYENQQQQSEIKNPEYQK